MLKKLPVPELAVALIVGLVACFGLLGYSYILEHSFAYAYLTYNVVLAAVPLILSWRLTVVLKTKRWSAWEPLLTTLLWIIFLPNSFYMISDYIHLQLMGNSTILYNSVMFSAFIYLGLIMGIISLYQVHVELRKRLSNLSAAIIVAIVLLGCCFAIYLGRDLRWNSWDVVINPGGLLFDISNLILKPRNYPDMGRTIISFFVFLGSVYLISWYAAKQLWHKGVSDLATHLRRRKNS